MKSILAAILVCFSFSVTAQSNEAYFLSNPCLTPDGQTVIFSFEGDLWKAEVNNGLASRLTAMQGYETSPRVSPDGRWLAFTGRQFGNADVFVMPLNGGEIKQLTYNSANDEVCSWGWDSKTIYFQSNRLGRSNGFTVSINGGTPKTVFGDYFFQYDHNLAEDPVTGEIFFNDTWESSSQLQRKRYKGPFNPDIQSYNLTTKQYKKYTTWQGKDFGATIDRKGNIYFISDEVNGEYNLYNLEAGKKNNLTKFNSSIKSAFVNANGGKVVFEKDYQLWMYDVASKKSGKLNIEIVRNSLLQNNKDYDVRGKISSFDVSPDGKKIAFTSRGELFVSDIEGKFIEQINKGNAERALEVKWLNDNKTLLFNETKNGYLNLFTIAADGSGGLKKISSNNQDDRCIAFNKKRTKAVYLSGRNEVRLLDLTTMKSEFLTRDELWGFNNAMPAFSPNDQYISFTAFRGFEQDIMLYNMQSKKVINLTNTSVTETNPMWSADGKYIYFTSSRLKPSYPFGMQNPGVYRIALENIDAPYRSNKFAELFKDEKKDTAKKASAKADSVIVKIDMDRIMERIEPVSSLFGSQGLVAVYQKGDKTTVFYSSNQNEGKSALWKTVIEPFEENKTEKVAGTDGSFGYDIVTVQDKFYLLSRGDIYKLNADQSKADAVKISFTFRRNLQAEFAQMFEEAWAKMEINYYDEDFHGVNWQKIKEKYQPFIAHLNNRADMRTLLNDMLGELNSSHQGFNTGGDDEKVELANRTMETGIVFENNDPYKVKYIIKRSAADHSDIDIQPGDILQKVNDVIVDRSINRYYYFSKPSLDKEITLTFTRANKTFNVNIHPQSSLFNNLYDEWIDRNQQRVDEKSKNRIAYACMKNMGTAELQNFIIDMTKELNNKDALILDIRYNTGGNVHDEVLKFLSQRAYLKWKYREGKKTIQSNYDVADKPIVLLINEQSLSDAEMTSAGFKALKLGTIIGNETYHWIIFTSGTSLVDGSTVRLPSWGCYTLDGTDLEKSGVQPDIKVIDSFEDKINGRDPQIDRAVEEIMKKLK